MGEEVEEGAAGEALLHGAVSQMEIWTCSFLDLPVDMLLMETDGESDDESNETGNRNCC